MSYYITMNVTAKYENEKKLKETIGSLVNYGVLQVDEKNFNILDECDDVVDTFGSVVDYKSKIISFNNIYMRNGYRVIELLEQSGLINGRITSTDGNLEFTEINDSNDTSYSEEDIFKIYNFKTKYPKIDDYEDDLEWEDDWNDYMEDINDIQNDWINGY